VSRTILVTGAEGFVGRHLVRALEAKNHRVITHTRRSGNIACCDLPFDGVEHVFHLAARTYVPDSWINPRGFYAVNVMGTANVMEFCRQQNASATLVSSYVYGQPERLPVAEDHPVRPFNPYAHSKILAEEVGRYYEATFGVKLSIIRPFNLYGPGQSGAFLIPKLLRQAISPDVRFIAVNDIRPRRDHLFIDDFVELLLRFAATGTSGVFNAGSGTSFSIQELVEIVNSFLEEPKPLVCSGKPRLDEVFDVYAETIRARRLGWEPRVPLREGLRVTLDAMRDRDKTLLI
jgi:nucleoside-diphosphate-sugar epimerase